MTAWHALSRANAVGRRRCALMPWAQLSRFEMSQVDRGGVRAAIPAHHLFPIMRRFVLAALRRNRERAASSRAWAAELQRRAAARSLALWVPLWASNSRPGVLE